MHSVIAWVWFFAMLLCTWPRSIRLSPKSGVRRSKCSRTLTLFPEDCCGGWLCGFVCRICAHTVRGSLLVGPAVVARSPTRQALRRSPAGEPEGERAGTRFCKCWSPTVWYRRAASGGCVANGSTPARWHIAFSENAASAAAAVDSRQEIMRFFLL